MDGAVDFHEPVVISDNAEHGGKAEPGALANRLGGEERIEDAIQVLPRNAHSRVADQPDDVGAGFGARGLGRQLLVDEHVLARQGQQAA